VLEWLGKIPRASRPKAWLRPPAVPKRTIDLLLVPGPRATWNSSAVNGRAMFQLVAEFTVTNRSEHKVAFVSAKLRKPAVEGFVHVLDRTSGTHGAYSLEPNARTRAWAYFYVLMAAPPAGANVVGDVGFVDQYGNTHWVEKVRFRGSRADETT